MLFCLVSVAAALRPRVQSGDAEYVGIYNTSDTGATVSVFAGIRYGTTQRFAAATPASHSGTVDASKFGPACPQLTHDLDVIGAEDCLSVDVVMPLNVTEKLPVMVWIHGGGLVEGAAYLYDLKEIVSHGVIGVSIQYRLNVLGFLPVDAPNPGLSDQTLALEWVQEHIGDFGGDKTNVTIFGQSAGGTSVLWLASNPQGLFQRVIAESPWFQSQILGGVSADEALTYVWDNCYCSVVDCSSQDLLAELTKAPFEALVSACGGLYAVVDRPLVKEMCDGATFDVALLVGSNTDEEHIEFLGTDASEPEAIEQSNDELASFLENTFLPVDLVLRGDYWTDECAKDAVNLLVAMIRDAYDHRDTYAVDFFTDYWFTTPVELASRGNTRYLFEQPIVINTTLPIGTVHCTELPYTLGFSGFAWDAYTQRFLDVRAYFTNPTPAMQTVHTAMMNLWLAFAKGQSTGLAAADERDPLGRPFSLLANATVTTLQDQPVHTRAAQALAHAFHCNRGAIRDAVLADSACSPDSVVH